MLGVLAQAPAATAAAPCSLGKIADLPVTMEGLNPVIDVQINGQPVRLIVDSGAFFNTLNSEEAARLKLRSSLDVNGQMIIQGINGSVGGKLKIARDFSILGHGFKDVNFVAVPQTFDWRASGFVGQNFLNATSVEYDLGGGAIRFFLVHGCDDTALAYWSAGKPFSMIAIGEVQNEREDIRGEVVVNGVALRAVFDTGAERSILTLGAAAKAGIKRDDPNVQPGGLTGGIGRREVQTWIAPVRSFQVGDEEVRNTRLRFGAIELDDADMLVGADFFLSHRLFVDHSHHRLYFTYNGGPVFRLEQVEKAPAAKP